MSHSGDGRKVSAHPHSRAMILSPSHPLLSAALSLIVGVGGALAAESPATESAATPAKPGWLDRVAAAPKKLAFWEKDKKNAPATPAGPAPEAKKAAGTSRPSGNRPTTTPATKPAAAKRGAPAAPPAESKPPSAETPKRSFFTKLPALSFRGKSESDTPRSETDPPTTPATEKPVAKKARLPQSQNGVADPLEPAKEDKKSGFLGLSRPRSGAAQKEPDETEPAPVARTTARPSKSDPPSGEPTQTSEEKPSFWSRVTAAVAPNSRPAAALPPKPQTKPIPKGLAALGVSEPDANTFVITKDESPFYTFGPQQATPPDEYLRTGTVVTLTQKSWGWATVQLPDGRTGMVDRSALRPALITDLIPSGRSGDPLMAALSPNQLKRQATPNFILPAAEMPDLPTGSDSSGPAGNPLLLPFTPEDIIEPGDLPALPEIQPLPEPTPPADPAPPADTAGPDAPAPESAPSPPPAESPASN